MLHKLAKHTKFIQASTLMESLVALTITTLMIWFVFRSIPYTFTPINPERRLEAFFVADSLLAVKRLTVSDELMADTLQLKGFTVAMGLNAYDTISTVRLLSIKVMINRHVLAERNILLANDDETKN